MSTSGESVVIWGELLWDRFPDGDRLGGAPANVAWHLGQAGGWAQLVTRVGDDEPGRRAVAQLEPLVDVSLIQVDSARATGEVTVATERGEARYTLHAGRAWERIACTREARAAIAEAGVLVYGTLAQRTDEGLAAWREAVRAARDQCMKVCDINLRPGAQPSDAIREAVLAADLLKVNDREVVQLGELFGWRDPVAHLATANSRPRTIVVTHGAHGATIHTPNGVHDRGHIAIPGTPAAPGGDNVGCGDAFVAILVHGLTCGWGLADSGRAASRWAAAVAEARGATPLFDDERIEHLLEAA